MPTVRSPRFSENPRLRQASENNPPLVEGERGDAVAIVQLALVDLGFYLPRTTANRRKLPDGIFGKETLAAIREFQRATGLDVDGAVGRQTLAALDNAIVDVTASQSAEISARIRQRLAMRRT
jgi:peptidoglycan hydrolase-like protein with peptidoglycan-binding domain